jgi:hypothetical protein
MLAIGEIVHYTGDGTKPWDCIAAVVIHPQETSVDLWVIEWSGPMNGITGDEDRTGNTYHLKHEHGDSPLDVPPPA